MNTDLFVPPSAEGLPLAALDSATEGADRLDAFARTPQGRNFLAHALVQLARDGWLRTEAGEGFERMPERETAVPAAGCVVSAAPTQAVDRAALSEKLWRIAEHHIVAEWICCEALDPKHELCAKGYAALGMVKTLLVDADPAEAWNPSAPLLDAVLAVLPPPTARAALERVRAVLETEAVIGRGALEYRGLILSALMADEAQQQGPWTADDRLKPHAIPAATTPDVPSMTGGFDASIEIPDLAEAQQQPDTETLAAALDGLHTLITTSIRDWGAYRVDAWLWAVLCGWDCEQDKHGETCTHGAMEMEEMQQRHGWSDEAVAKARRYRAAVRALTEPVVSGPRAADNKHNEAQS